MSVHKSVSGIADDSVPEKCLASDRKTERLSICGGTVRRLTGNRKAGKRLQEELIIVRGGGDLATGTIHCLVRAGFRVLVLESERPAAIRRQVSLCEAIYDGRKEVEGVTAVRIHALEQMEAVWQRGEIPLLADPEAASVQLLSPDVVVDAILAKKNMGTSRDMAPLTIALGPGYVAGEDVDAVIETMRGHNLGRIITKGSALPNTGVPGNIGGYTAERVLHAGKTGVLWSIRQIGDLVEQGEPIAVIQTEEEDTVVEASISGLLRGLIRDGYPVKKGFKIADIDPRKGEYANCFTISDKARCIAGSVLELVCGRYVLGKNCVAQSFF